MIKQDGWDEYCIWEHSFQVKELYRRRCRGEAEEMTCAAQAADILKPYVASGDTLLDAGCGSGYFYHSLLKRSIDAEYRGIDAAPSLIKIGQAEMPAFGLDPDRLNQLRIEDLNGTMDHVVCMNVLTNIDNYHRPLERLLKTAQKTLLIRESCAEKNEYRYVRDQYLDAGADLNVYVNTYNTSEIMAFIRSYGFTVEKIVDRRTNGSCEMVIGYPHYWTFFFAQRK